MTTFFPLSRGSTDSPLPQSPGAFCSGSTCGKSFRERRLVPFFQILTASQLPPFNERPPLVHVPQTLLHDPEPCTAHTGPLVSVFPLVRAQMIFSFLRCPALCTSFGSGLSIKNATFAPNLDREPRPLGRPRAACPKPLDPSVPSQAPQDARHLVSLALLFNNGPETPSRR